MKTIAKLTLVFTLIAVLAISAMPTFAQDDSGRASTDGQQTRDVTLTEERINQSFRVQNPRRLRISDVSVDLKATEEVDIYATITALRGEFDPIETVTTMTYTLDNGRLYWTATSVIVNGEPVSDTILEQVNRSIESSWRRFIKQNAPAGRILDVQMTDEDVTLTLQVRRNSPTTEQ